MFPTVKNLKSSLHGRLRRLGRKAETARLRRILRPGYQVSRLSKMRDALWAHVLTRRTIALVAALVATPSV
jgi:hypothetical protein